MTNEGWQLQEGLRLAGFQLWGYGYEGERNETDVRKILEEVNPSIVAIVEKREWDNQKPSCFVPQAAFRNIEILKNLKTVFKVCFQKDAHHDPSYDARFYEQVNPHAWVTYYDVDTVVRSVPAIRREHVVRTWHMIDKDEVVDNWQPRRACLLSGAVSGAYPLRQRLFEAAQNGQLGDIAVKQHPGYGLIGWQTANYLRIISRFSVLICTASIYKYELRRMIEATASGCRIITDLPPDRWFPIVRENCDYVSSDVGIQRMKKLIYDLHQSYDVERQQALAERAKRFYDYRQRGESIRAGLERLMREYNAG